MKLSFVTWDGDLTQFLVEAETGTEAIAKAMKANAKYDEDNFGERDPDDEEDAIFLRDMGNPCTYFAESVDDMEQLAEICRCDDCCGTYEGVIVFND